MSKMLRWQLLSTSAIGLKSAPPNIPGALSCLALLHG